MTPPDEAERDKQHLRRELRQRRSELPDDVVRDLSARLRVHLLGLLREGWRVGLYAAAGNEPSVEELCAERPTHCRWTFPRVTCTSAASMEYVGVTAPPATAGSFGVREPVSGDVIGPAELDAIVIPGLAFSSRGDRLGMGAGYFDRFLEHVRADALRIGSAFHWQILGALPVERHDVAMTHLVTERGVIDCERAPSLRYEV